MSTPREMVRLLEMLEAGKIVNPAASKDILDILAGQQVRDGIARHAPEDLRVASKSGALDALRSDVGIVYAKGGPIAMAITVDEMPVDRLLARQRGQHAHLAARVAARGRLGRALMVPWPGADVDFLPLRALRSESLRILSASTMPRGVPPRCTRVLNHTC